MPRGGVILAGGRSSRFGDADKATAELAGEAMIVRVARRLDSVTDELIINCRDEQEGRIREAMAATDIDYRFAIDPTPDRGPMAGIRVGLDGFEAACAGVVVACDMPFVEAPVVDLLFEVLGDADAAVPRIDDPWLETTHAVYRRDPMVAACDAALDAEEDRIVQALDRLDVRIVDRHEIEARGSLQTFENVNTRDELADAARTVTDE